MSVAKPFRAAGTTIVTALVLAVSGCASTSYSASLGDSLDEMDPIVLNLSDFDPPSATLTTPLDQFTQEVEERTNGKISFQQFYSEALMPGADQLSGIGTGVADVGRLVASYTPQELPVNNWMLQLGSTSEPSYPHGIIQGSATSHEVLTEHPAVVTEFEEHNVVPLMAMNPSQEYSMICNEELNLADDTQGIRARTAGPLWTDEMSSIGVTPVSLSMAEVYEGMQRGVIECAANTVPAMMYSGLWDVGSYLLPIQLSQLNSLPLVINKDLWDSLPDDAQQIMRDVALETWQSSLESTMSDYEVMAEEGVGDRGIEVIDPAPFADALSEHQESVIDEMAQNAPDSVSDPEAFIDEYLATQDEWADIVTDEISMSTTVDSPDDIIESYREGADVDLSPITARLSERLED